ncbi:MAG: hypothetical protein ACC700_16660 [Anaerolineales bacterium]
MEYLIAAITWILYLVLELRQEILTAFAYADAPLILLGLILYLRVRRQRRKKESGTMFGRRSVEDELFDAMVEVAETTVNAADQAVPLLDYALAELPNIDNESEVRRSRDVLAASSKELRKGWGPAVGPESIRGVKKSIRRIWDNLDKTEEIRDRARLLKEAHAFNVATAVDTHRLSLEGLRQILDSHDQALALLGVSGYDPITPKKRAFEAARLTAVKAGQLYGSTAGQGVEHPVLGGIGLLAPSIDEPQSLPKPEVEIVEEEGDEDERRPGGFFSGNGSYHSHSEEELEDG